MIYRIITEDKNMTGFVEAIVSQYFDGFSISKQIGYYKGQKEASIVIEIDTLSNAKYSNHLKYLKVIEIGHKVKELLQQESILIQALESDSDLI